jgi:tetratricopeptide (TPR) repeat protein
VAGLAAYATAIEAGRGLPPSREYAQALLEYSLTLQFQGDYSATDELIERALTAARAGGYREEEKELLAEHAAALVDRGLFARARDRLAQSMRVSLCDPPNTRRETGLALSYDYVLGNLNELRPAIASSVPAIRNAERAGLGDGINVQKLRANVVEAWTELGDVVAATLDPITGGRSTRDTSFIYLHRAHLDLLRGRMRDAEDFWVRDDADVPWGDSLPQRWELSWRRAEFYLWLARPEQALLAVRPLLD